MHKFIIILFLMLGTASYAQNSYSSLLWKIEGNGLDKPSYLYGTMHVSSKIAFNLGDEFFDALSKTDAVALETNPENWLDYYRDSGLVEASQMMYNINNSYFENNFYKNMTVALEYNLKTMQELFMSQDRIMNQLLYRYNYGQEKYEETTYLDMFIFQSAKKNKKPIYSLEDFLESYFLAERSNIPDNDEDELNQYSRSKGYQKDLQTAYLERNLDLLDSIISENFSKNYRKYLLNIRNENMVLALDTLMPKMSIFAGVGAAHLPGKEGMIELLRNKGYQVNPVTFEKTVKINKSFRKLKKAAVDEPLKKYISPDKRVELTVPGKFYQNPSFGNDLIDTYFLPDYANGAYYSYERMPKYLFEKGGSDKTSIHFIDSVLYLITPGDIQEHKNITIGNYPALELSSKLPRENYLKILCIETPEEIMVFKTEGNKAFIKSRNVKEFFKNISIAKSSSPEILSKTGFHFKLKSPMFIDIDEERDFQIIGDYENQQYTLKKAYLNDFSNLEQDDFELKYFMEEFADNRDLKIDEQKIESKKIFAALSNDKQSMYVQFMIYHNHYLRITYDGKKETAISLFDVFEPSSLSKETFNYEEILDTILKYEVTSIDHKKLDPKILEEFYSLKKDYEAADIKKDSLQKDYKSNFNTKIYTHPGTGENILVQFQKVNQYFSLENGLQDLRDQIKMVNQEDTLFYETHITKEQEKEDYFTIDYYYTKEGTDRILLNRAFLIEDRYITIITTYDTLLGSSRFVSKFFETFHPFPSKRDILSMTKPKCEEWLSDIKSETYQEYEQAKKSIESVIFEEPCKEGLLSLVFNDTLNNLEDIRRTILGKYNYFYERDTINIELWQKIYEHNKLSPKLQIPTLHIISEKKSMETTALLMDFLEDNPPIIRSDYDLNKIFGSFNDSSELLLPIIDRLQRFGLEYEEYLPRIIYLIDRGIYNKSYGTEVIIPEFEEKLVKKAKKDIRKMAYANSEETVEYKNIRDELVETMSILYCYEKPYEKFGTIMELSDTISNKKYRAHLLSKRINRNNPYTGEEIEQVIEDTTYVYTFFSLITDQEILDSLYEAHQMDDELLYHSYLFQQRSYNSKEDSIFFTSKQWTETFNDSGNVFVYKLKTKYGQEKLLGVHLINQENFPQFESLNIYSVNIEKDDKQEEKTKELIKKVEYSNRPRVNGGDYDLMDYY